MVYTWCCDHAGNLADRTDSKDSLKNEGEKMTVKELFDEILSLVDEGTHIGIAGPDFDEDIDIWKQVTYTPIIKIDTEGACILSFGDRETG